MADLSGSRLKNLKKVEIVLGHEGDAKTFDVLFTVEGEEPKTAEEFTGEDRHALLSFEYQLIDALLEVDEYVQMAE